MVCPFRCGGLNVIQLESFIAGLKCSLIRRYISDSPGFKKKIGGTQFVFSMEDIFFAHERLVKHPFNFLTVNSQQYIFQCK